MEVNFQPEDDSGEKAMADSIALARAEAGGLDDGVENMERASAEADAERKAAPPEWLPTKFVRTNDDGELDYQASLEAMSKAHAELERNFHKDRSDPEAQADAEPKAEDQADAPLVQPDFFDSLVEEYNEKGELTADSMELLKNIGIPETIVQDFISGQQARAAAYAEQVVAGVGGMQAYEAMTDWAAQNFNQAEIAAFDAAVESGDVVTAQMAVRDLRGRYEAANGSMSPLAVQGGTQASGNSQGYGSRAEMTRDIQDPRYSKDPAFREQVMRRIGASDF